MVQALAASGTAVVTPNQAADRAQVLAAVRAVAESDAKMQAPIIDRDGLYPADMLRKLGAAGAFAQHLSGPGAGGARDLMTTVEAMALVGEYCGCTSFLMWLQNAFGWYLEVTENTALRDRLQPAVAAAQVFGSSGMSNPVKAMDGIENFKLRGERVAGGYVVSGVLPYVSNLGIGHVMGTAFELAGDPARKVMAAFRINGEDVKITQNVHFIGLEGSATYTVVMKRHFVADEMVLAESLAPYVKRIKPVFFLLQAGMALGQIRGAINVMRDCDRTHGHANAYLPKRPDFFEAEAAALRPRLAALLRDPLDPSEGYLRAVYRARLEAGELALEAAQAALLHAGAKGYIRGSEADRRWRETLFVAVVTPALKHLRKALAEM